jgi:hypothetical protein
MTVNNYIIFESQITKTLTVIVHIMTERMVSS